MTNPSKGRFERAESLEVAQALWQIGMAGDYEDDFAPVEGEYYNLILVEENDVDALTSPAYIAREDSDGFFTYKAYPSAEAARKVWNDLIQEDQVKTQA